MEAALAIATLVLVLVLCLAGVTAVSMQVRCIDAAREAARLAARGDVRSATDVARQHRPACGAGPGAPGRRVCGRHCHSTLKPVAYVGHCC